MVTPRVIKVNFPTVDMSRNLAYKMGASRNAPRVRARKGLMMESKTIEIRDSATFIPALALRLSADDTDDQYLLERAGFGQPLENYILLIHLEGMRIQYNPFNWGNRTMQAAHQYIESNFDSLRPGEVVDVQVILGEHQTPKASERFTAKC